MTMHLRRIPSEKIERIEIMTDHFGPEVKIYENRAGLCAAVAQLAVERIREGLTAHGVFHLALTGGSIGTLVTEELVRIWNLCPADFSGLHIWWGDERFLPEMNEARNARPVIQKLQAGGAIHIHEAPSSDMAMDLDTAARVYRAEIADIDMDLSLFSVGEDGHLASLFPGKWSASETRDVIAILDSPKPPAARITFTMAKINTSNSVWLLAVGENKRHAVLKIFARNKAIPTSFVHGTYETRLFLDRAANPTH
jgi:6-phosphogluconolactonase